MTMFDVIVVIVLLVSSLIGFVRGAAREFVTLVSFLFSAILALLLMPVTAPLFAKLIDPDWVGKIVAVVVVFMIAYFGIHALGNWLREKLHSNDHLGGIDRFVGLGFGLARGLVILGIFHLGYSAVTPPARQGAWFRESKSYGVSAASAKTIQAVLPKWAKVADAIAPKVEASARQGVTGEKPPRDSKAATGRPKSKPKPTRAYDERQRDDLDALVEKSR